MRLGKVFCLCRSVQRARINSTMVSANFAALIAKIRYHELKLAKIKAVTWILKFRRR